MKIGRTEARLILSWRGVGVGVREIARRLSVSPSTVARRLKASRSHRARSRKKNQVHILARQKCLFALVEEATLRESGGGVFGNKASTSALRRPYGSISRMVRGLALKGIPASRSTVRRDLAALGFRARVCPRGPRRREGDTEARVRFCRHMLGRQWRPRLSNIIFSDEKLCDANDGRCWWWCRGGELAPSRQLDRWAPAVHVWGAVGINFKLLVFIDEKISSGVYVRHCLQTLAGRMGSNRIFQQDNARPHVGPEARRWFRSHHVEVLPNWPPRSPDLSPIENMWSIIQGEVDRRAPLNKDDVKKFWMQEWEPPTGKLSAVPDKLGSLLGLRSPSAGADDLFPLFASFSEGRRISLTTMSHGRCCFRGPANRPRRLFPLLVVPSRILLPWPLSALGPKRRQR